MLNGYLDNIEVPRYEFACVYTSEAIQLISGITLQSVCQIQKYKKCPRIGAQTHTQDFGAYLTLTQSMTSENKLTHRTSELTSHSRNDLFVAFEGTNLCSDILKLYLGASFLRIMSKSHHSSDILVQKSDYTTATVQEIQRLCRIPAQPGEGAPDS